MASVDLTFTEGRRSVCPRDCPDVCSMIAQVEDGKIVRVVGDPDHPITRGFLCGRFQHYEELIHHPDRLLHPLARERKSDPFERVSWDEALDLVAQQFRAIADEHGPAAILPYRYLGNMGILGTHYADRLWNRHRHVSGGHGDLRDRRDRGRAAGVRSAPGNRAPACGQDELFLAWGKNPKETNVHGWVNGFKDIHPLIVIDSFKSDTALAADISPASCEPATDSMLAIGMMRLLIENDWVDHQFLEEHTIGYGAVRDKVMAVSLDGGRGRDRHRRRPDRRRSRDCTPSTSQG